MTESRATVPSATDDLIAREPFEPVGKLAGFFCRFEDSPIDAELAWPFLREPPRCPLAKAFPLTPGDMDVTGDSEKSLSRL